MVFALIGLAVAGDSRSFREARIHPLLSTMAIALVFRWAGFYLVDKLENSAAYTLAVYLVPLVACAIAIFFIATNRVMELPMWVVEKIAGRASRIGAEAAGLWRRLTGSGPSASGGRA